MFLFLIPLLVGFGLNSASALTTAFSRRWGERRRQQATLILRTCLGIPLWVIGLGLAVRTPLPVLLPFTPVAEVLAWSLFAAGC